MSTWLTRRAARAQAASDRRNDQYMSLATDEAMSQQDAAAELGRSGVLGLVWLGVLEPAVMKGGYQGVSRASVEQEKAWLNSTPRWRRFCRRSAQVVWRFLPF